MIQAPWHYAWAKYLGDNFLYIVNMMHDLIQPQMNQSSKGLMGRIMHFMSIWAHGLHMMR